jgi:nicotinamide-nucleotide amidase
LNAIVLTIGDEILIGQVIDTNSAWIGNTFNEIGINILEILSVGDELTAIKDAIDYVLTKADLVIVTGGLGPTKDDITKTAIAQYFGVDMVYSQSTYDRIEKIYEKFGRSMTPAQKEQCYMPANAKLLTNRLGTAPGMLIEHNSKTMVALPGVPYEMKAIITEELLPILSSTPSEVVIVHKTIMTAGEGETVIADKILPFLEGMPDYIKLAYLPSLGSVRLRLTGKHKDGAMLEKEIEEYANIIVEKLGAIVYAYGDISLEESLLQLFSQKGLTLSAAESCTGGYFSHKITSVSGSSQYFMGSVISYSNAIKSQLLGVKEETLQTYGAVSEETVTEMVAGLLKLTKTNIGVSVSGIAGPGGGSADKPVGTIWMAISDGTEVVTYKINATKDRAKNIEYATTVLMNKLRLFVNRL